MLLLLCSCIPLMETLHWSTTDKSNGTACSHSYQIGFSFLVPPRVETGIHWVWVSSSGAMTALFCQQYGIVLDAGSSHTNLYVYEWPAEKENDTGVVQQVEVCKVEGKRRKGSCRMKNRECDQRVGEEKPGGRGQQCKQCYICELMYIPPLLMGTCYVSNLSERKAGSTFPFVFRLLGSKCFLERTTSKNVLKQKVCMHPCWSTDEHQAARGEGMVCSFSRPLCKLRTGLVGQGCSTYAHHGFFFILFNCCVDSMV